MNCKIVICLFALLWSSGGLMNRSYGQRVEQTVSYPLLGLALKAPDYDSKNEVERHAAYSAVLAAALTYALEKKSTEFCKIAISVDFPDLLIAATLRLPGTDNHDVTSSLLHCVQSAEPIWADARIDAAAFEAAARRAEQQHRRDAAWDRIEKLPSVSLYRLRIIGRAALRVLYRSDSVIPALVDIHRTLLVIDDDYLGFSAWLSGQRQSGRMGICHPAEPVRFRRGVIPEQTTPSVRPNLQWEYPSTQSVPVRLPEGALRPVILLRCSIDANRRCISEIAGVLCNRERVRAAMQSSAAPASSIECAVVSVFGIQAGLAIECDDEVWLKELYEQLAGRREVQGVGQVWSLVKQVAWIPVK